MYEDEDFVGQAAPARSGKMWVECRKCRATMFSTFDTCWSCGTPMTGKNSEAVRF
jgi:hypothetical protein